MMKTTTSGQTESSEALISPPDEAPVSHPQDEWDEFDKGAGLYALREPEGFEDSIKGLFALTGDCLSRMTPQECCEGAYTLGQFAFFLQRKLNEELCKAKWADENVRHRIRAAITQKPGSSYDERRRLAVADSPKTRELEGIRVKAQLRAERLTFLSQKAEQMARTLLSLQASKRERA